MEFRASGKLLITAEYSVLRGALALSVPTKYGQKLTIEACEDELLHWKSIDEVGKIWFEGDFKNDFSIVKSTEKKVGLFLAELLKRAHELNPVFSPFGFNATTVLEFNPLWGLGSSSTLVTLVAKWAKVDALDLFFKSSIGSGYDVATAVANSAILYALKNGKATYKAVDFNPPFKAHLHFLYLDKKQRSAAEVVNFKTREISSVQIEQITAITNQVLGCTELATFKELISEHERLTSKMLGSPPIKEQLFADFNGEIKSLGAWGGDFVLVISSENCAPYFKQKGYNTLLSWGEMLGT